MLLPTQVRNQEWQQLLSSLRRVPWQDLPAQPDLLRVTVGVLLPLLPLVYPCSFLGHTNPFLPPYFSLTAPCLMLPLPACVWICSQYSF